MITSDILHKKAADIVRQCGTRDAVTIAKEIGFIYTIVARYVKRKIANRNNV